MKDFIFILKILATILSTFFLVIAITSTIDYLSDIVTYDPITTMILSYILLYILILLFVWDRK